MARADLLVDLVRAGAEGDQPSFRKALERLVVEERDKQHHVLADRLAEHLRLNGKRTGTIGRLSREAGSALFERVAPRRRLGDLSLSRSVRETCRELLEEHQRADLLRAHNLEPRHRVLLAGPPGNGKTSLAEAIASELAVPLLVVRYESLIGSFLGETAARLATLFNQVQSHRCVLFFDEFDVVGKERGDVHETGEIKRVVSSLLLQVDALPSHVVVAAATNHPELLDRAAWRRFQVRLDLQPPDREATEAWLLRLEDELGSLGQAPAAIADRLYGLSFADLEQFALDVKRRYILTMPEANLEAIVRSRLSQWSERFTLESDSSDGT